MNVVEEDRRLVLELLSNAIDCGSLYVEYQPQYDNRTEAIVGVEALARLREDETQVSPAIFIPLLERLGLAIHIDIFVFESVCKLIRRMLRDGVSVIPVSVNCSRETIADPRYIPTIELIRERYSIPASLMRIELTETSSNTGRVREQMTSLHILGYTLELDDFGIGSSGAAALRDLPVDYLKLDASFIREIESDRDKRIVGSIVSLADELGVGVIAEGVETLEQNTAVSTLGCHCIQGYYYSRPVSGDSLYELVSQD